MAGQEVGQLPSGSDPEYLGYRHVLCALGCEEGQEVLPGALWNAC